MFFFFLTDTHTVAGVCNACVLVIIFHFAPAIYSFTFRFSFAFTFVVLLQLNSLLVVKLFNFFVRRSKSFYANPIFKRKSKIQQFISLTHSWRFASTLFSTSFGSCSQLRIFHSCLLIFVLTHVHEIKIWTYFLRPFLLLWALPSVGCVWCKNF